MKEIDSYSYHLGAADCFCEMVAAGVKKIALSHLDRHLQIWVRPQSLSHISAIWL